MPRALSIVPLVQPDSPATQLPALLPVHTHNLPAPVTSLVGRQREIADIRVALCDPDIRLLTLTGPPGVGKTRLALRAAEELAEDFSDGVRFVPLADIRGDDLFLSALALALDVRAGTDCPLLDRLQEHLSTRKMLLLLDNCEQLESPAALIAALLASAHGLKIVATSRTLLHVYGEHEFRTRPLELPQVPCPGEGPGIYPDKISGVDSVALFIQRAHAANPDFALTAENAHSIAMLCAHLDGLPLALELAAALTKTYSPEAMLAMCAHRFDFLRGGARDLPDRHQSLSAALDWSYGLLAPDEQRVFRRLSVFVGGCTMEAANAVANMDMRSSILHVTGSCQSPPSHVGDWLVISLAEHNLLTVVLPVDGSRANGAQGPRFAMLETVREYGLQRLEDSGDSDDVRHAHARYFLSWVECQASDFFSQSPGGRLAQVERELGNLRSALDYCACTPGAEGMGLRMSVALGPLWLASSHLREGLQHLTTALRSAEGEADEKLRAEGLALAGQISSLLGRHSAARPLLEESIHLFERTGDVRGRSRAIALLGHVMIHLDDLVEARSLYEQCLALRRNLGDQSLVAMSLSNLADLALHTGDLESAAALYQEGLNLARSMDNWAITADLSLFMSYLLADQGKHDRALALSSKAIEIFNEHHARRSLAYCLALGGEVAFAKGLHEVALQLFAGSKVLFDEAGVRMEPPVHTEPTRHEREVEALQTALGEEVFAHLWSAGQQMGLDRAISLHEQLATMETAPLLIPVSDISPTPAPSAPVRKGKNTRLSERELEVLRLVSTGLTNAQVADRLNLSPFTVNMHLRSIYGKLGVSSRTGATRYAVANRLV